MVSAGLCRDPRPMVPRMNKILTEMLTTGVAQSEGAAVPTEEAPDAAAAGASEGSAAPAA
jgi:hypothetical protein